MEKALMISNAVTPFNSPLEAGIRAACILYCAYPTSYDLQKLIVFDHLVVHTEDIGGPSSLHPELPLRNTEILVRRELIETGLLLMMSRNLIERLIDETGISYRSGELAQTFLDSMTSPYLKTLISRSDWVIGSFGGLSVDELRRTTKKYFSQWVEEFQSYQKSLGAK